MSTTQDLMGLGMPAALAARIGLTPINLTATGTAAGTAATIPSKICNIASATSQTGAILNSALSIGSVSYLSCATGSSASAVVYPPTGATINNATSVTLAADKSMIVWRYSSTLFFYVILA